jgi:hypothetical protein
MKLHRQRRLLLVLIVLAFSCIPEIVTAQRFVDNLDGTVTDTKTGLMWQQADDDVLRKWDEAGAYCESLVLPSSGAYSDWRVPGSTSWKPLSIMPFSTLRALTLLLTPARSITGRAVPMSTTRTARGSWVSTLATCTRPIRPTVITSGVCASDHFGPLILRPICRRRLGNRERC